MSPFHYTKDVTEAYEFCKTCNKLTLHFVSDGRRGRCKEHTVGGEDGLSVAQRKRKEQQAKEKQNPRLF